MDYVDQVRRLVDALIFSLSTLPNSVDNNEVKHVLTVLVEACQASYFMKNDYIYYSTLEEDKNFETELFEPDNLLEKNLDAIENKISKLTSVKIKKNYEACQLSNFIKTDKCNINSLDSSLEKVETQETEPSYPENFFETNLEVPENKVKENSIKGIKDNDENFQVKLIKNPINPITQSYHTNIIAYFVGSIFTHQKSRMNMMRFTIKKMTAANMFALNLTIRMSLK